MQSRFLHSKCERCVYLGQFDDLGEHDLYICGHAGDPVFIARYGDKPTDVRISTYDHDFSNDEALVTASVLYQERN